MIRSTLEIEELRSAHTVQEPGGGRGILIQWPTVVHATAYVVELYEENASSLESFRRCPAKSVYITTFNMSTDVNNANKR